jgi:hypothetical protein
VIALVWVFREPILGRLGVVASASARQAGSDARAQLSGLDLSVERIAQELKATGRVVRRKAAEAGRQIEESTRDARTTAKLKARFDTEPLERTQPDFCRHPETAQQQNQGYPSGSPNFSVKYIGFHEV